ncbi:hypothetical protein [Sphingobacterium sp. UGAL515B_05]|uniref:hypothetical protein n=1 Tax=Sphingobacterium sp. UGAL515B_05 TaxID=2986767 RepID=UPI0029543C66|nr:hypothetical protein [Sphingobacterium sp. UGAL515B_05]WON94769.1 hypothetical protein OK025_26480 [Sphingobacterium sp. UGAL515B_05]
MDIKKAIRALLQTKFGGAQLSSARVDELAKRFEGKVTTEEELEAKMGAINEYLPFTDLAKDDDRARSVQAELDKLKTPTPAPQPTPPEPTPVPAPAASEEVPSWAKAIIDGNKTLTETVQALKSEKIVTDRQSLILGKLANADKDYSAKVLRDFSRMSFATDEDFTTYLTDVETDFANHTQTQAESKLGKDSPFSSVGKDGKVAEASQAEVDKLFGDIKI